MACTNGQVLVRAGVIERIGSGMVFDNIEEARSALKATGQSERFRWCRKPLTGLEESHE